MAKAVVSLCRRCAADAAGHAEHIADGARPAAARGLLTVLFYNVCQIAHVKTLDFGKLTGFIYFSGVITFCFYSLIHLKRMLPFAEYRYDAIYFILLILCFAWGGDTAAYFAGRAFGRHKLAPIVSPHKTVEGAVGGVLGSMAAGCVLTLVYSLLSAKYNVISIQVQPKHYLVLLGMGAVASVLGILGDLFASSVKRQVGIKDYGTIFPGHGGILDRFDSVMFIAPFVSIAVRYFFYLL
ncbi:phosphatidate cytidylyltransferase [Gemmiger formicilis]|nr:phosphatidate cytidylyltransferase [Gemmiger formicilis]